MQDLYIGDTGKGFPLVLVHGFLGSSEMWEPQIKFFKNNFRVITPDLPGFGKNNKVKSFNDIHNQSIESKKLKGLDSLLSIVQMPSGIPVGSLAVGKAGADNAALLAISILGTMDSSLKKKYIQWRQKQTKLIAKSPK